MSQNKKYVKLQENTIADVLTIYEEYATLVGSNIPKNIKKTMDRFATGDNQQITRIQFEKVFDHVLDKYEGTTINPEIRTAINTVNDAYFGYEISLDNGYLWSSMIDDPV